LALATSTTLALDSVTDKEIALSSLQKVQIQFFLTFAVWQSPKLSLLAPVSSYLASKTPSLVNFLLNV
jgi:hypothetical protein